MLTLVAIFGGVAALWMVFRGALKVRACLKQPI
jgi:hypothetical protein